MSNGGISASDIDAVQAKFLALSKDYSDAVFSYNESAGRWEVHECPDKGTLIAHSEDGWE